MTIVSLLGLDDGILRVGHLVYNPSWIFGGRFVDMCMTVLVMRMIGRVDGEVQKFDRIWYEVSATSLLTR